MLHDNMNISLLMVHDRQVEEAWARRKTRDGKRASSFEGGFCKIRLKIQEKPRFKKRFSNQVPTKFPKARNEKGENPKPQKRKVTTSPNEKPTCGECGKKH